MRHVSVILAVIIERQCETEIVGVCITAQSPEHADLVVIAAPAHQYTPSEIITGARRALLAYSPGR